jgi:hypothetical protein
VVRRRRAERNSAGDHRKAQPEINAGLADPVTKARLAAVATTTVFYTLAAFGAGMAAEIEKWGRMVKASGAKPDLGFLDERQYR